jgi:chemotaxis protein methyltransferase CheR
MAALQQRIGDDPADVMQLLQFLSIPVSKMFRDPVYFRVLRVEVVPVLRTYPFLKLWVAGCSTGEEVYSQAINKNSRIGLLGCSRGTLFVRFPGPGE